MDILSGCLLLTVALIWGTTNPLMKKGTEGIESISYTSSWLWNLFLDLKFLLTNWKYLMALLLNLSGSLLYYYSLGQLDLTIVSPLTNTLTFVFTYLSGIFLFGEKDDNACFGKKLGLVLVCTGTFLCILDKYMLTLSS